MLNVLVHAVLVSFFVSLSFIRFIHWFIRSFIAPAAKSMARLLLPKDVTKNVVRREDDGISVNLGAGAV